jgi:hypothetical protein
MIPELKDLLELHAKTKNAGKLEVGYSQHYSEPHSIEFYYHVADEHGVVMECSEPDTSGMPSFIAAAHNTLPAIAAAVEALVATNKIYLETMDDMSNSFDAHYDEQNKLLEEHLNRADAAEAKARRLLFALDYLRESVGDTAVDNALEQANEALADGEHKEG